MNVGSSLTPGPSTIVLYLDFYRVQYSLRNKSSVLLDYIDLSNWLNQFEIFVSSLIHEKNIENCLF